MSMKKSLIEFYLSINKYYNNNNIHQEDIEYLVKLDKLVLIKCIKDLIDISI